jgi:hypothetical protein
MTDGELTIHGRIETLHLELGNRIIVTLEEDRFTRADVMDEISKLIQAEFPGHKVIMLANGLKITRQTSAATPNHQETNP